MYTSLRTLCNYVFIFIGLTDSRGWTSNDLWLHSAFFPFNERTKDNYSLLMDKRTVIYIKKKKIKSLASYSKLQRENIQCVDAFCFMDRLGFCFSSEHCFFQRLSNILYTALLCYLESCVDFHLIQGEIYQHSKHFCNCFIGSSSGGSILST